MKNDPNFKIHMKTLVNGKFVHELESGCLMHNYIKFKLN